MKKYTAHLTGYNTTAWGCHTQTIQVDSLEEAKLWCHEHSFMGGCDWHVDYIVENKKGD